MYYLWLTIISGVLLGFYDIFKKKALEISPLLSVLSIYTTINFVLVSFELPNAIKADSISILLVLLKSVAIFGCWMLEFVAIRGLPISIVTPFGTLSPIFSIIMGVVILNERIGWLQGIGLVIIFGAYYFIGRIGAFEVSGLFRNKYLYFMAGSTLLAASSALIDKVALKGMNVGQMQFWFSFFTAVLFIGTLFMQRIENSEGSWLKFSWYIPVMSLLLIISDRIYFAAVQMPESPISVVIPVRKISIIVSTIIGGMLFKEKNLRAKFACVCVLLVGIAIEFAGK